MRDSPGLLSLSGAMASSPLTFGAESPATREPRAESERPAVKSRVETASEQLRRGRELLKEEKPLLAEAMVRLALQGFQDCLGAHHLETTRAARSLMEALVKQAALRVGVRGYGYSPNPNPNHHPNPHPNPNPTHREAGGAAQADGGRAAALAQLRGEP